MICKNCGTPLNDNDIVCSNCGQTQDIQAIKCDKCGKFTNKTLACVRFVAEDPVDIKKELITAFHDTQHTSTSPGLNMQTAKMIRNSKIYGEEFWKGKEKRSNLNSECEIIVEENTSFSAAKKYLPFGRTAVLNFANPVTPGGGVQYGAMAQEECLCRSSNLYEALSSKVMDEYYNYHLEMDSIYASDRLIYSPKVTVFKDDSQVPKLMPKNDWFSVDVITCAAPYNNRVDYGISSNNPEFIKETFKSRI